jgi:hypothetical protein
MGALIDSKKGLSRKEATAVRNRFDRKRIYFVLEETLTGDVLALVELDVLHAARELSAVIPTSRQAP